MNKKQFYTGAIEKKFDHRNYRFELVAGASDEIDEFDGEPMLGDVENQGKSLSCVAQEVGGYAELLNFIETGIKIKLSKKYIYSKGHMPQGGMTTVDAIKIWQNDGIPLESDIPSYDNGQPPTEEFMIQPVNLTDNQALKAKEYICGKYTTWNNKNFETYRQAIRIGKGVLVIVYGENEEWQSEYVKKPNLTKSQCPWAHQILFINSKPFIKDGIEYLKFRNSWGRDITPDRGYYYMPREYIESGLVVNPITVMDIPNETYVKLVSKVKNLQDKIIEILQNMINQLKIKIRELINQRSQN